MNHFEALKSVWADAVKTHSDHPWMAKLERGEINLANYKGFLLETYHNTSYNPQLQAFTSMYLRNNPRLIVKKFYQHAISEIGHDLLAKSDLMALGVPETLITNSRPLPETTAFFGYFIFQIQFVSPLTYLGYLFHLEFSPTTNGMKYVDMLKSKGVPSDALTFLEEHATVDVGHNKLMESYVAELVKTKEEIEIVGNSIRAAVALHSNLLFRAFENGERLFGDKAKSKSA